MAGQEVTPLAPSEEQRFQAWARANKITDVDAPQSYYDYRGYWKENGDKPIRFGVDHFTDTYKQHGHPTFSVESKYSKGANDGGRWQGERYMPQQGPGAAATDRELTDKELLAVFGNPKADLAMLSPGEQSRLVKLTETPAAAPAQGGPLSRFAEGVVRGNPVTNSLDFLSQMVTDPKGAGAAVVNPSLDQLDQMVQAHRAGKPLQAVGHAAGAIPLVGPFVAGEVDRAQSGDVAGALGALSWLASPALKKGAGMASDAAVAGAKRVAPNVLNRVADRLENGPIPLVGDGASERLAKVISPQTGPNKTRFGNAAMKAAPDLLRDPELSGYSRTGLASKITDRLDQAIDGLDTAADARLASQQVRTRPLLVQIDKQIADLTAEPVDASAVPRKQPGVTRADQLSGVAGEPKAEPYGKTVEPAPNSAEIATLRRIRDEVSALGPVAPYESIRRIRQSWDKVAKVKYLPATAQDALKSQGDATAAAKGTAAMREGLAQADPASAQAYQQYSLYKNANDVVQAAEEADRVRPNRGRGIMARAVGAGIGAKEGGALGAMIGATVASIADKAAEMAPTFQIAIARKLAAVADAIRSGAPEKAQAMTDAIVQSFPAVKTGLRIVGKGSAAAGRATIPARMAAQERDDGR